MVRYQGGAGSVSSGSTLETLDSGSILFPGRVSRQFSTYASWGSDDDPNVNATVDYDSEPPTLELGNRGAVSGWMLCEMIATTIMQNNNQELTSTCEIASPFFSLMLSSQ